MNSKYLLALFASVAVLKIVDCTFGTEAVVSGLGVHIPLLSATAGTLSLPLAVLGVLKLAIAVKLAGGLTLKSLKGPEPQYEEPSPYGRYKAYYRQQYRNRNKRSANDNTEAVFSLVSSLDMYSCGKALICGLEARNPQTLSTDEQLLLALFADRKSKHFVNPGSAKAEYDLAAELGLVTKSQVACRKRYSTCPYTADEMISALRQSQI